MWRIHRHRHQSHDIGSTFQAHVHTEELHRALGQAGRPMSRKPGGSNKPSADGACTMTLGGTHDY